MDGSLVMPNAGELNGTALTLILTLDQASGSFKSAPTTLVKVVDLAPGILEAQPFRDEIEA
jgi:hypothetical protein